MNFTPLSENELKAQNLIPEGIYDFQVLTVDEKVSKNGNNMLEMKLKVWDREGKERVVFDYLVDMASLHFKINNFCKSIGRPEFYTDGLITPLNCESKQGKLRLVIQKDKKGKYPDKNSVQDYIHDENEKAATEGTEDTFNDDIPF